MAEKEPVKKAVKKAEVKADEKVVKPAAPKTAKKSVKKVVKADKPAKKSVKKEATPKAEVKRGARRERQGVVISDKMAKTIVVEVTRLLSHPKYGRVIKRKAKATAHDEKQIAKKGDTVRIVETRPLSKTKRWKLIKVVS